jgi:hypothetical protein
MTGTTTYMRQVYRFQDADHFTLEIFTKAPDGSEYKMMEIAHTRLK